MENNTPLEIAAIRYRLRKAKNDAEISMLKAKSHEIIAAHQAYTRACEELDSFEDSLITPEQREIRKMLSDIRAEKESVIEREKSILARYYELFPDEAPKPRAERNGDRRKTTYEDAQEMRRKLAPKELIDPKTGLHGEGLTNKELGEQIGFTKEEGYGNGYISPIKNYKSHPLREGDFKWL